ncbi:MAG: hypothetical protein ABI650_02825 [Dokdonella sp.]
MNDFELQRQLRELRGPRAPSNDLWAGIAERLGSQCTALPASRQRRWWPLAAAATIALALTTGIFSLSLQRHAAERDAAVAGSIEMPSVRQQIDRARALALIGDPRLASAEVVLDAASVELEQALQQQPDAVYLVGMINRTHAQRRKLARLGIDAG